MDLLNIYNKRKNDPIVSEEEIIYAKKEKSKLFDKAAQKRESQTQCLICGKKVSHFCASHTVPAFCLKNIAVNGNVVLPFSFLKLPIEKGKTGVGKAGVFYAICNECDSTVFQDYEDPEVYLRIKEPTSKMLAQMALKISLRYISKRRYEAPINEVIAETFPEQSYFASATNMAGSMDERDYLDAFEKAKQLCKKGENAGYFLIYYSLLDYVTPLAVQTPIALIADFNGGMVNDAFYMNPKYKIKDLYLNVIPLENKTAVCLFMDNGEKRFSAFYKKFNRLSDDEKLMVINYLIFLYSEDFYLSPYIQDFVQNNESIKEVMGQVSVAPVDDVIKQKQELFLQYSLAQYNRIPNVLAREYKIR